MLARLGSAFGLLALLVIAILRVSRPPSPVPATAPDTVFSAERALRHVEQIAARPHPMGSAEHDRVRDYIVAQLTQLGIKPQIQATTGIGTRYQEAGRVQNILAWLPGRDAKGKAVLLAAHYDGVPAGPAASDDGAGSAALLETARALRAQKQPLAQDVILLFTDGEESGLLGAAAFAREHPWAKDAAVILNFEARGTSGRSYMFETGAGNADAVHMLRKAGDVTAGSTFITVYRALPNDTDISEFAVLGLPALNFAFVDGVERYHTTKDDVPHLNPGSLQHHGSQMLALARAFANEPLPRPTTGDAVFFDLPVVGLVAYPEGLALPLAVIALILTLAVVVRSKRRSGVAVGFVATLVSAGVAAGVALLAAKAFTALHAHLPQGGTPMWSGWYAAAIAALCVAVPLGTSALVARWSDVRSFATGALVVWTLMALIASIWAPGVSYLFVWSSLFMAVALFVPRLEMPFMWLAAAATILTLAGLLYGASVIMLGVVGPAAIVLGVFTALISMLLLILLTGVFAGATRAAAVSFLAVALTCAIVGAATVKSSPEHPVRSALVYAENADSTDAWLGAAGPPRTAWTREIVGTEAVKPAWASRLTEGIALRIGRQVSRAPLEAPNAVFVRDTLMNGARRVVLRVTAPRGATTISMRANGAPVSTASVDGRVVDTKRYRYPSSGWELDYWAVPDSGAIVALSIPAGAKIDFEVTSRTPGLPAIPGVTIPPRPPSIVPSQDGDVSVVYRKFRF